MKNPDGSTPDNPRSIIDFGVFQGHNRVINWQEILLTPDLCLLFHKLW